MSIIKKLKPDEWLLIISGILISTLHINIFYYSYGAPKWFVFDLSLSIYLLLNAQHLKTITLSSIGILLASTLLYCVSSSFWAPNTGAALELCLRFLLVLFTGYALISKYEDQQLYRLLTNVTFFSATAFIILFYFERYILQNITNVGSFSPLGFINNIGQVFNIWIPVFVLLIFNIRLKMHLIAIILPILIALVSILMEASVRGCIIGLFAGEALVFTIMLWKDAKKAIFFLSTSLLLFIGIGSYTFFDALEDGKLSNKIAAMENAISPSNGRMKLYANSFDMLVDNPLGVGSNNFEYIHPKYGKAGSNASSPFINEHQILRTPHNIFLKFYTEQGFVGGTLFFLSLLTLFLLAVINAIKGSFRDRWILVAITATLFHSLLSAVFLTPGSLFFSIFIFAIIVKRFGTLNGVKSRLAIDFHPSLSIVPALIIGISISSLVSKYYSYQGSLLASPQLLSKSLQFNPYNERALYTLAHLEYRKNRDIKASLEAIDSFIEINPYHLSAIYVKSERLFQMKLYSEANQTITQLLKFYPGYKKAQRLAKAIRRKLN